jgi:hypothetical protein
MGDFEVEIGAFNEIIKIGFTAATREFGYAFEIWNGAEVIVVDVEFAEDIQGIEPETGKFARVYVSAENTANDIIIRPEPESFVLLRGNNQLSVTNVTEGDYYTGGEVQPGVIREGYLNFVVPDDATKEELTAVWSRTFSEGDVAVYWNNDGERK